MGRAARAVDVLFRRGDMTSGDAAGRACAVVDVLRAATSAAHALAAGAKEVRLFRTVEEARASRAAFEGEAVLAGERGGLAPEGFDAGNSPKEFTPERVAGRTVFFSTTNGTCALSDCASAAFVAFASLANVGAVARALAGRGEDVLLVCSGTEGRFSAEDALCAGMIVEGLAGRGAEHPLELRDGARIARDFARRNAAEPARVLAEGEHGRRLGALGLGEDVAFSARVDCLEVVPVLKTEPLRLMA